MVISTTTILAVVSSVTFTQTVTSAVTAMSKPKREDGIYAYWFRFLHSMMSVLKTDKGGNIPPPGYVDQTSVNTVTTPTTQTETATSTTTTAIVPDPKV